MRDSYYNDDCRYYDLRKVDRIVQRFLGGDTGSRNKDDKIPLRAVVQVGSVDPSTGKEITKKDVIDYWTIHNQQAERNKQNSRKEYTEAEKRARKLDRQEIISNFRQRFGYDPDKGTVKYLLEERWPERYNLSIDQFVDAEEGDDEYADRCLPLYTESVEEQLIDSVPDTVVTLREFAATLTGVHAEVYRLLLDQAGGNKVTQEELAKSMGISRRKFCSYVRELKDMYKEYVAACP